MHSYGIPRIEAVLLQYVQLGGRQSGVLRGRVIRIALNVTNISSQAETRRVARVRRRGSGVAGVHGLCRTIKVTCIDLRLVAAEQDCYFVGTRYQWRRRSPGELPRCHLQIRSLVD